MIKHVIKSVADLLGHAFYRGLCNGMICQDEEGILNTL